MLKRDVKIGMWVRLNTTDRAEEGLRKSDGLVGLVIKEHSRLKECFLLRFEGVDLDQIWHCGHFEPFEGTESKSAIGVDLAVAALREWLNGKSR